MKKLCKEHDLSFSERRQIKAAAAEFCRTNDGNIIGYNIQFPNGTGVLVYCDKDGWTGFRMMEVDGSFVPYRKNEKMKVYRHLSHDQFLQALQNLQKL